MKYSVPIIICVCFKLVVTDNKNRKVGGHDYNYDPSWNDAQLGYNYILPYSNQVVLLEELTNQHHHIPPPQPIENIPQYLPPQVPVSPPTSVDSIPFDDTIAIYPPPHDYLPPPAPAVYGVPPVVPNTPQVKILNMSCLDGVSNRFFRSVIHTPQILDTLPVIDNSRSDCVQGSGDIFKIDLSGNQLIECGIRYCSSSENPYLCASIRFPTLRGLKLPEDYVINLHCKPQERIASHTKHLKVSPQITQGRTVSNVATGGIQRTFASQVSLLRKAPDGNEFNQVVTPGSAVNLGEDLLLKAVVRDGDGWKYSRIGDVTMQHVGSSRTALSTAKTNFDSVTMVDSLGCRVLSMKSVCPEHPRQVSSLITTMPFRAFMFQGANSGDEMVLSIRMLGCLLYEDCFPTRSCEETALSKTTKVKRSANTGNSTTTDWQSYLEFKVVLPELKPSGIESGSRNANIVAPIFLLAGLVTVAFSLSVYLIVTVMKRNPKINV